ncbi:MAG TPA: hypothetical protein VEJ87_00945 [Acidimicrobiales bacterium]|nr:hypothetical protein [Acidimicrobiales bacterium]
MNSDERKWEIGPPAAPENPTGFEGPRALPAETIEELRGRTESELEALRRELAEVVGQADAAEHRLTGHAAAALLSDAFEGQVVSFLTRALEDPSLRPEGNSTNGSQPQSGQDSVPTHAVPVSGADPRPTSIPEAHVAPDAERRPSSDRPRTVVVDRNRPPAASPRTRPPVPPDAGTRKAARKPSTDGNKASTAKAESGRSRRRWSIEFRSRLLIQIGVVIVLVTLLLLKLLK